MKAYTCYNNFKPWKIALDKSMTFHKMLLEQYQTLWLSTPVGVDNYLIVFAKYFIAIVLSSTASLYTHYENKPIQIYWKFHHQKMKIFR